MTTIEQEQHKRISEDYWNIVLDMMDEAPTTEEEDKVHTVVAHSLFYPCGNCGEVVYAPTEDIVTCPFCGEHLWD